MYRVVNGDFDPVNRPELIACEDCKHWKNNHICMKFSKYGTIETAPDFYCGFAEKREDE